MGPRLSFCHWMPGSSQLEQLVCGGLRADPHSFMKVICSILRSDWSSHPSLQPYQVR